MLRAVNTIRRLGLALLFMALIVTNVLTLTSSAFNAALSGLLSSAFGVHTVFDRMSGSIKARDAKISRQRAAGIKRKAATRKFGGRLLSRTQRVAAKSIAAIPAESIPFIGVAVLIADTGYELYAACETVRELDQLYATLGMADEIADAAMQDVCDPDLPAAGDVWNQVVENIDQWRLTLIEAV